MKLEFASSDRSHLFWKRISLIKSGSGCTVSLEPLGLEPSFMAHFVGLWTGLAENLSELWNSQPVAMEIRKKCQALGKK